MLQGHTMGTPCHILTLVDGDTIYIDGATEFVIA
jgi:hypothetical protein